MMVHYQNYNDEIARLSKLAYIGEHQHDLNTYKQMAADLAEQRNSLEKQCNKLKEACYAALARLENPLLDASLFNDVKLQLREVLGIDV